MNLGSDLTFATNAVLNNSYNLIIRATTRTVRHVLNSNTLMQRSSHPANRHYNVNGVSNHNNTKLDVTFLHCHMRVKVRDDVVSRLSLRIAHFHGPRAFKHSVNGNGKMHVPTDHDVEGLHNRDRIRNITRLCTLAIRVRIVRPNRLRQLINQVHILHIRLTFDHSITLANHHVNDGPRVKRSVSNNNRRDQDSQHHDHFTDLNRHVLRRVPTFSIRVSHLTHVYLLLNCNRTDAVESYQQDGSDRNLNRSARLVHDRHHRVNN